MNPPLLRVFLAFEWRRLAWCRHRDSYVNVGVADSQNMVVGTSSAAAAGAPADGAVQQGIAAVRTETSVNANGTDTIVDSAQTRLSVNTGRLLNQRRHASND
jgi:hypothetical protein